MNVPSAYRPGACNIGSDARRERRRVAAVALFGAIGYATFVLVTPAPRFLLLGLFVPLSLGVEWWLQARRSFCATLALQGRYDFRGDGGTGAVEDETARREDRRYAVRLTVVGLAAGAVLTGLIYAGAVAAGL
jgi:hypothetical protein